MDLDERAVKIVEEATIISERDLRGALAKMREALAIEPDYPNLEDEIFIREDAITKLDGVLEFIVVLLREGKDYQACEMLQELPDNYIIQDKSGLVGGLVDKITKAQVMVEQARGLSKADCVKALAISREALKLVTDYPGLAENIASYEKMVAEYNSFISAIDIALKGKDADKATDLLGRFREVFPEDPNISNFKVAIINLGKGLKKRKEKRIDILKIVGAVGTVLVVVGTYFAYEMILINKAGRQWQEVNRLLAGQKFTETRAACAEVNQNLGKVRLFFLNRKQDLQGKIDDVIKSEVVVQGAEGKVLFDGDYIPKEQLGNTREIKKAIEEAKVFLAGKNYLEAIRKFEEALAIADSESGDGFAGVVDDIKLSIASCRLNIVRDLVAKAGALKATGSLYAATVGINTAIEMIEKYSVATDDPLVVKAFALKREISQAKLKGLIAIGDKLFIDGNFDNALKAYIEANVFAKANSLNNDGLDRQISGMINRSKVEDAMRIGDSHFASANWAEAVPAYEKVIDLALKNGLQNLASFQRAQINVEKSKKMQLIATLDRQNKLAGQHSRNNRHNKAKEVFEQALIVGEGSRWGDDSEVGAVLGELKSGLAEVEERIFIDDKKKFLRDRYGAILKKDFGLGGSATLLDPEVVLLTANAKLLKFMLSAMSYTKKGGSGKYSRYEVIYVFDRETGAWKFADKSSSSN